VRRPDQRDALRHRFDFRCGYCGVREQDVGDDDLDEHLIEQPDGNLAGLTETGRFHIEQLQLNRPPLIRHRLSRRRVQETSEALEASLRRQEELRQRIAALEQAVADAQRRLSSL
jgi:hypothetical protein